MLGDSKETTAFFGIVCLDCDYKMLVKSDYIIVMSPAKRGYTRSHYVQLVEKRAFRNVAH